VRGRVHDWTVVRCAAMSHRGLVLLLVVVLVLVCLGWDWSHIFVSSLERLGWLHGNRLF
jgi:hypothetical protein